MSSNSPSGDLTRPAPDAAFAEAGRWPLAGEGCAYPLRVNGRDHVVDSAWLGESLLYVLRERLGLPGAKNACEQGECGACVVTLGDVLVCSCCVLAADAVDAEITTIESLGADEPTDVQRAMVMAGAVQCGFCTPGFVMAIEELLRVTPQPSDLQVREALSGNLCRCTGYGRILEAVRCVIRERSDA